MNINIFKPAANFYFIFCFLLIFFGCKKEPQDNTMYVLWTPYLVATIDDSKVDLNWAFPWWYYLPEYPYSFTEPDIFEIYISTHDMSNFNKFIELKNDKSFFYTTVKNLQNSTPYYFYIVSKKQGFESRSSNIIMVIPNQRKGFQIIQESEKQTFGNISFAQEKNKLAYVDANYTWNNGNNRATAILISNLDGSNKELVDINSYSPCWSPANDKIAFHTEKGESNQGYGIPSQIALYNYETKTITKLTTGNDFNYNPVFSNNGEFLLYQSNNNSFDTYSTNIWLLDLSTLNSTQVTDISNTSLRTVERPNWIDNDRFLFHGAHDWPICIDDDKFLSHSVYQNRADYKLYESSVSSKLINKVFDSKWNDFTPAISPNKNKIAFVSDRSNTHQVWIYNIDNKSYQQITGYENDYVNYEWNNIFWLDNSTLIYTLNGCRLVKQTVD
jgi:Tol biopolymer transport system component